MATIASLNVNLGMSTDVFQKGTDRALSALESIQKSVAFTALATGADVAGRAIAFVGEKAIEVGRSLAEMVKGTIDAVDQLKDAAQTAGVTTDALSALQYTATINGSSAEAVTTALTKMNTALGEANTKGGPAADALAEIGLNVRDLVAMEPDKAFAEIAQGFSGIISTSQRARIAQEIFGKSSRDVLNVLDLGKGGIAQFTNEAKRLGIVLTQIDANKIGAAKDALDKASAVINGIKVQVAASLAPAIELAANHFSEMSALAQALASGGIRAAIFAVGSLGDAVDTVRAAWNLMIGNALVGLAELAGNTSGLASTLSAGLGVKLDTSGGVSAALEAAKTGQEMIAKAEELMAKNRAQSLLDAFDAVTKKATDSARAGADAAAKAAEQGRLKESIGGMIADGFRIGIEKGTALFQGIKDKAKPFTDFFKNLQGSGHNDFLSKLESSAKQVFESTRTPAEKLQETVKQLQELRDHGLIDPDTLARGIEQAKDSFVDAFQKDAEKNRPADPGEFRQINARTDVAGLGSLGAGNPIVDAQNKANAILGEIRDIARRNSNGGGATSSVF